MCVNMCERVKMCVNVCEHVKMCVNMCERVWAGENVCELVWAYVNVCGEWRCTGQSCLKALMCSRTLTSCLELSGASKRFPVLCCRTRVRSDCWRNCWTCRRTWWSCCSHYSRVRIIPLTPPQTQTWFKSLLFSTDPLSCPLVVLTGLVTLLC